MFENIEINFRNFTVDVLDGSGFYTMDHTNNKLTKKNSSGALVSDNFLNSSISQIYALSYDGVYFWSLERPGSNAALIKKWEIGTDTLVRLLTTYSLVPDAVNKFDSYSMAVEYYRDTLASSGTLGSTTISVTDGSIVRVGDTLTLGPSTGVGYAGLRNRVIVVSKIGNNLTISPALTVQFNPVDPIYFSRSIFLFSDASAAGNNVGCVYQLDISNAEILAADINQIYGNVRASTFFKNKLMFLRGSEIIWLTPETFRIFKTQGIDNLDGTRGSYQTTYALTGYSDTIYRLERERITYNSGTGTYTTNSWATYNFNSNSTISEIFFVRFKADPPVIHKAGTGISPTPTSALTIEVLDQFKVPLFGKFVELTSTGGGVSPIQGNTDVNGKFTSTYTADTSAGQVTLTATAS